MLLLLIVIAVVYVTGGTRVLESIFSSIQGKSIQKKNFFCHCEQTRQFYFRQFEDKTLDNKPIDSDKN